MVHLSKTIAQTRVERLVTLGLADTTCSPSERISQLRSRLGEDERTYRELEAFFAALGDATRLKMLKLISDEELCSCEVMAALKLTQPTTSHHLGILERAGLLTSKRNGKWVFYRIANSRVQNLIKRGFGMMEETSS